MDSQLNKGTALFLLGAAAGAVAAALTTPRTGREVRHRIKDALHDTKAQAVDKVGSLEEELRDRGIQLVDKVKS